MPSFADSIFLFVLALLLFGPKKLPVLARELGKWMGEFRRASNEFKMQMEDELRASEQADRQKQIAAMEAAAPIPPPLDEPAEPEHPHLRHTTPQGEGNGEAQAAARVEETGSMDHQSSRVDAESSLPATPADTTASGDTRPVPIATSGSLHMMPPATGLPTPRSGRAHSTEAGALTDLVDAIPAASAPSSTAMELPMNAPVETGEEVAHGD